MILTIFTIFRLFGGKVSSLPHPDGNWDSFIQAVAAATEALGVVWDPIKQVNHPWIRIEKLTKIYSHESKSKCIVS